MEVLVGSRFGIDVSSVPAPAQVSEHGGDGGPQDDGAVSVHRFIKKEDEIGSGMGNGKSADDSADSSSIGAESENEEDNDDDDVVTSEMSLGSLASLEDSLPIKNGLSNYYSGKSRSFADLSQLDSISSAKDLGKPENPFNKRRRIQMANKWWSSSSASTRSSSSVSFTLHNSNSTSTSVTLNEEDNTCDEAKQQKQKEEYLLLKSESRSEISDLDDGEDED